jgi:hypothetical protein
MTITPTQAANLAVRFRDVTRMVREKSAFHLPVDTSPRAALDGYLQACKVCGVLLHNEHWQAEAEAVVEELTAKRRAALEKLLRA